MDVIRGRGYGGRSKVGARKIDSANHGKDGRVALHVFCGLHVPPHQAHVLEFSPQCHSSRR